MRFSITDELPHPLDLVFPTQRDKLEEFVDYLPNVEKIETVKREEEGDIVRLENHWRGAATDVPKALRPFVNDEMLSWIDHAEWDASNHRCKWRIELGFLPGAIEAKGETSFREEDGETVIDITGDFIVHADKLPGPSFVVKRLVPTIESFVVGFIQPNLRKNNAAVMDPAKPPFGALSRSAIPGSIIAS